MSILETKELFLERAFVFRELDELERTIHGWLIFLWFGYLIFSGMLVLSFFIGFNRNILFVLLIAMFFIITGHVFIRNAKREIRILQEQMVFLRKEIEKKRVNYNKAI